MAHYSSTAAIDLPFAGELDQGGPSRDPRYAPALDVLSAF